jgi:hypothetical protein
MACALRRYGVTDSGKRQTFRHGLARVASKREQGFGLIWLFLCFFRLLSAFKACSSSKAGDLKRLSQKCPVHWSSLLAFGEIPSFSTRINQLRSTRRARRCSANSESLDARHRTRFLIEITLNQPIQVKPCSAQPTTESRLLSGQIHHQSQRALAAWPTPEGRTLKPG